MEVFTSFCEFEFQVFGLKLVCVEPKAGRIRLVCKGAVQERLSVKKSPKKFRFSVWQKQRRFRLAV